MNMTMTEPEIETLDQEISRVVKNGKIVQQVSGARPRKDIYQKVKIYRYSNLTILYLW